MAATVVAERVSKRYGETVALDGVSLSVDAGEVFALVGPNGAGKTTLVGTLTGTKTVSSGTVSVLDASPKRADRSRIGLLPQSFSPPERLTPRELLTYYAGLYEEPRPVDEVLSDVGLLDADGTRYANLSGGQQRRVCVGITLVNDPDLLFLDEPTTGIDPAGRRALWDVVRELADRGTTVFVTTHYMEEAETLADRVGLLDGGELVEVGPPADLLDAYGGPTRLRIGTSGPPGRAVDSESEFGADFDVETTDTDVLVEDVPPAAIGDVVSALEARGIEYDSLTWTEPSLEDVYLRLTDGGTAGTDTTADGQVERAGEFR